MLSLAINANFASEKALNNLFVNLEGKPTKGKD